MVINYIFYYPTESEHINSKYEILDIQPSDYGMMHFDKISLNFSSNNQLAPDCRLQLEIQLLFTFLYNHTGH